MAKYKLTAELRDDLGKGASRRLRRDNKVPAVLYGAGRPAWSLTLNKFELDHNLLEETFYASIIELALDGKTQKVFLRDLQRHPAKPVILHADFMRVRDDVAMVLTLPLHIINDETSVGIKAGGVIMRNMADIEISCLPKDLPEYIEVDVAELDLGNAIHLSGLKYPEGVVSTIMAQAEIDAENNEEFDMHSVDQPVVSILIPKVEEEIEDSAPEAPETEVTGEADSSDSDAEDDSSED